MWCGRTIFLNLPSFAMGKTRMKAAGRVGVCRDGAYQIGAMGHLNGVTADRSRGKCLQDNVLYKQ
jgi:hypothetical protein